MPENKEKGVNTDTKNAVGENIPTLGGEIVKHAGRAEGGHMYEQLIKEARELAAKRVSNPTIFYKYKLQDILTRLCDALEKEIAENESLREEKMCLAIELDQTDALNDAAFKNAEYEGIFYDDLDNEIISMERLRELVEADKAGRCLITPCIAMIEQSLKDGEMKPQADQKHNGRYAVVYVDKKKWGKPLIDICGKHYHTEQAEARRDELTHGAALAGKGEEDEV